MSITSSITIHGKYTEKDITKTLINFIKSQNGSVNINGHIQGGVTTEDGMNFSQIEIKGEDPFKLAESSINNNTISTIDFFIELENKPRYFNFDATVKDNLSITINANRQSLEDGMTDFTWYYINFVKNLNKSVIHIEWIEYSDAI